MTIEDLIGCDAAKLEAMSDAELLEHFKPMLDITRPERQTAVAKRNEQQMMQLNPKLAAGLSILKAQGIDVGTALQPYHKRRK